jgi:hypothetical protein
MSQWGDGRASTPLPAPACIPLRATRLSNAGRETRIARRVKKGKDSPQQKPKIREEIEAVRRVLLRRHQSMESFQGQCTHSDIIPKGRLYISSL